MQFHVCEHLAFCEAPNTYLVHMWDGGGGDDDQVPRKALAYTQTHMWKECYSECRAEMKKKNWKQQQENKASNQTK